MKQVLLLIAVFVTIGQTVGLYGTFQTVEEFVEHHNSKDNVLWKATTDNFKHIPVEDRVEYVKGLCGSRDFQRPSPLTSNNNNLPWISCPRTSDLPLVTYVAPDLPENYDPRTHYPYCLSLNEIRDQGNCGSCWAFACVEAATDRLCIQSRGTLLARLSAEDMLTCCGNACGAGCKGGMSDGAWRYLWRKGVVSGGSYNSSQGCLPYEVKACDHHVVGKLTPCDSKHNENTPECHKKCRDGYNVTFWNDKHYGKKPYHVYGEKAIMTELMNNGPISASIYAYTDFITYKSGIYHQSDEATPLGGHAVKMMGWGVENGVKYWLVANSWNRSWGEDGFFRILRGTGDCGELAIEGNVMTSMMDMKDPWII